MEAADHAMVNIEIKNKRNAFVSLYVQAVFFLPLINSRIEVNQLSGESHHSRTNVLVLRSCCFIPLVFFCSAKSTGFCWKQGRVVIRDEQEPYCFPSCNLSNNHRGGDNECMEINTCLRLAVLSNNKPADYLSPTQIICFRIHGMICTYG